MLSIKLFKRVKVNIVQAVQNGIALGHLYETPLSFVPGTLILTGPIAQEMYHALKVKDTIMKGI